MSTFATSANLRFPCDFNESDFVITLMYLVIMCYVTALGSEKRERHLASWCPSLLSNV